MPYKSKEDQVAYVSLHYQENKDIYKERAKRFNKLSRQKGKDFINTYLQTHPCVDCGIADTRVLEFDHVRGVKKINIANTISRNWSISSIEKEILKCDVRCANCHRIVTYERRKKVK